MVVTAGRWLTRMPRARLRHGEIAEIAESEFANGFMRVISVMPAGFATVESGPPGSEIDH